MQTDAEVAAIAAGLSEKQCLAVLSTSQRWRTAKEIGFHGQTLNALCFPPLNADLTAPPALVQRDYINGPLRYIYRLTDLGLRVAQHLKQENGK